ncbi:MAG: biopolymer transporter TolR [Bacteroidetes bacterium]|nr:MAG: biopolymer transporter TolR [Bacteroidota bacterium]
MKKIGLLCLFQAVAVLLFAQPGTRSLFVSSSDVGNCKIPGSYRYLPETQEYLLSGSGENMWFGQDQFHFAWRKMKGDFILHAEVNFPEKGVDPHRKAGWIVRHSLESNSPYLSAAVHGDGLAAMQYRKDIGGLTLESRSELTGPQVLQIERRGGMYIFSLAAAGQPLLESARIELGLGDEVYAGLFVCSHRADVMEKALFRNVRITVPAPATYVAYKDYPGSRLEVVDVETGHRRVLMETPVTIEAPNWLQNDSALIYNSQGKIFRYAFDSGKPAQISTGFASRNNNDHLISPDGKTLAVSNHVNAAGVDGSSLIYTLPLSGGAPRLVTETGPSYLHGWSPDGKTFAYCAERNKEYDVYTIPVKGGKEKRLTTTTGLDDGPEYDPSGKYIYFNSVRSGSMQVWRMDADGKNPVQITKDDFHNWFPHISPDGKWMAFVSFGPDVAAGDHPPCKHVTIRVMPSDGSAPPRVLAYVYGGQGTINVPSWSPDSKKLAFVSYSFPVE